MIAFIFSHFTGCATTGQSIQVSSSDTADIDELLGLEDSKDETIAEDDVLRLLGVIDEEEYKKKQTYLDDPESDFGNDVQQFAASEAASGVIEKSSSDNIQNYSEDLAYNTSNNTSKELSTSRKTSNVSATSSFYDRYQEARQAYMSRNFPDAIQKFESLLISNPNHNLSDNCQYWIGESYYAKNDYKQAIVAFERVLSFSNSNKNDDAQLKLGKCYIQLKDIDKAKEEFQKLINNYPASEYVSIAKRFIDKINN
jgi:tol-pal system protein YbgF